MAENPIKKKISEGTRKSIVKVIDAILSTAILLFAMRVTTVENQDGFLPAFLIVTLLLAGAKLFSAFAFNRGRRLFFLRDICTACVFLIASALLIILHGSILSLQLVIAAYYAVMISERVISLIANRRLRNIIFNAIAILLLLFVLLAVLVTFEELLSSNLLLFSMICGARSLVHIIVVSFAEMRLAVLLKIIRKTYAAEILFGLLILMVAFSFVFVSYEDSITNFREGMWYCFAVVTTIGFGDYTAVTVIGRTLTVILGMYGIIVVALITSIIVNFYNEIKNDRGEQETDNKCPDSQSTDSQCKGEEELPGETKDKEKDKKDSE